MGNGNSKANEVDEKPLVDNKQSSSTPVEPKIELKGPIVFSVMPLLIGFAIAMAIYHFGAKAAYDAKIDTVGKLDLQWPFIGAILISVVTRFVNFFPMTLKNAAMDSKAATHAGNIRANMYLYKVNVPEGKAPMPPVVLEEDGAAGMYNRANRSLHHHTENIPGVLLCFVASGFVFPFPSLVLAAIFSVGRAAHQIGYTGRYGSHGVGFMLATITTVVLEGLVLVASLKAAGVSI